MEVTTLNKFRMKNINIFCEPKIVQILILKSGIKFHL